MRKIRKTPVLSNEPRRLSASSSSIFSLRTKILLFTGLFLIIISAFYYLNQTIQLTFFVPKYSKLEQSPTIQQTSAKPTGMSIASVGISLPIEQTGIQSGTWGIAPDGISHLSNSANPGEKGPGIYYAHNTKDRFGPIRWLNKGAEIKITSANQKQYTYHVVETVKTNPDELSVFFKKKGEAIYLFTCDGFADLERYVVIAEPAQIASSSAL